MAKYKQFAKQGSFAENQLKVPDETGKIKEQTQRTVRGMNTAQAFLQKNQEIYLRAQQQANEVEQQTRENNFQFETQNRKAFQDALRRDTEIALRNDQIRANETQQFYKDLSSFSNTAFELAGQFEENRQKKLQTLAIRHCMKFLNLTVTYLVLHLGRLRLSRTSLTLELLRIKFVAFII
jgi:flagellar biosynthesis/type III secretory pathway protein FliH